MLTPFVLIIITSALVIQLFVLVMHYRNHFKLQLYSYKPIIADSSLSSASNDEIMTTMEKIQKQRKCDCRFTSAMGNEKFPFFPSSFCCYIAFTTILFLIVLTKLVTNPQISDKNQFELIDYILFYAVMIIYIWESLHSFYRYYTTKISAIQFETVSVKTTLTKFLLYIFLYSIIFSIYIHLFYYIYPLLILLHSIINIYCNYSFASILIKRYKIFLRISELKGDMNPYNHQADIDILESVYLMRKLSLLANIISIILLSIFLYSSQTETLYYLCIVSSISSFIFSMNFIRNRTYILKFICCKNKQIEIEPKYPIIDPNIKTKETPFSSADAETKNKDNYDRFNALLETVTNETSKKDKIHLNQSRSDNTHNKESIQLKPKYNSYPAPSKPNSPKLQFESKNNESTVEQSSENIDSSQMIVLDEYGEATPVPMEVETPSKTYNGFEFDKKKMLENKFGAKSNPVNFKDNESKNHGWMNELYMHPPPKILINNKSAPNMIKNNKDFEYINSDSAGYEDEKHNMTIPKLKGFRASNSRSAIDSIRNILKFGSKVEKDNDYLIDEKEDNTLPNIDQFMASLHILAKDGFCSTRQFKRAPNNKGNKLRVHHGETPMSHQINYGDEMFLKPSITFNRRDSV